MTKMTHFVEGGAMSGTSPKTITGHCSLTTTAGVTFKFHFSSHTQN